MSSFTWRKWMRRRAGSEQRPAARGRRGYLPLLEGLEQRSVPTTVSGHITADTTWSGSINVIGNVVVDHGVTLTIQAGTMIAVNPFATFSIAVDGTLDAPGTAASPIIFTSARDPAVGGTGAASNDWSGLQLNSDSSNNVLNFAQVRFGGQGVAGP
jgi:hypothetical protein